MCELENGELVVIPRLWLSKQTGKWFTYWVSSVAKAKEYAIPNPKWPEYEVKTFWAKTGNLELEIFHLSK